MGLKKRVSGCEIRNFSRNHFPILRLRDNPSFLEKEDRCSARSSMLDLKIRDKRNQIRIRITLNSQKPMGVPQGKAKKSRKKSLERLSLLFLSLVRLRDEDL